MRSSADTVPLPALRPAGFVRASHNPSLDGVRGIAILMVLTHHFFSLAGEKHGLAYLAAAFARSAWCGVDLFFVLSGFLITGILLATKSTPHYFRRFYIRRACRIFPLYYMVLCVAFTMAAVNAVPENTGIPTTHSLYRPLFLYWTNFASATGGSGQFGAFFAFWSLAVEEHFYLVWPFVVFGVWNRRLPMVCVLVMMSAFALRLIAVHAHMPTVLIYSATYSRMDALAAGSLLAVIRREFPGHIALRPMCWAMLLIGFIAIVALNVATLGVGLPSDVPLVQTVGFSVLALTWASAIGIVVTGNAKSWLNCSLQAPVLRWYGKYSYGIYVFHGILIYWTIANLDTSHVRAATGSTIVGVLARPLVGIAGASLAGWLSYHTLEKYFLRLKDRWAPSPDNGVVATHSGAASLAGAPLANASSE